jgi:hypothetical protein
MTELRRLRSVKAEPRGRLRLRWHDGTVGTVSLVGVIARHHALNALEDAAIFSRAKVIDHGLGVGWPGDLDMSAAMLGRLAGEQRRFGARDFVHWQETVAISNVEAAGVFGVSLNTIKNWRQGRVRIPDAVAMACRAMSVDDTPLLARLQPRSVGRPRKAA